MKLNLRKLWARTLVLLLISALAGAFGACSASGDARTTSGFTLGTGGHGGATASSSGSLDGSGGSTGAVHFGSDAGDAGQGPPPNGCDPTSCTAANGLCTNNVCTIRENPGNVSAAIQSSLEMGGSGDPSFAFLYPYDKTVFPRGLTSPTLQFADGTPPDAMYVHVSFPGLEYQGFFGASNPAQIVFTAPVWDAIGLASNGAKGAVQVEVTKSTGGVVAGPITEHWTIATGSLKGTIYYETYGSAILGGPLSVGIMQIQPGASLPTVVKKGCGNVCHTASADGSTLVAATTLAASASYDLKTGVSTIKALGGDGFTYGGIYPDGSFVISATNFRTWLNNPSRLYNTQTGANIATPSWDSAITNGGTPAFSPDGTMVVFNHEDLDPTGAGHTLALMSYDAATMTFSGLTDLATDPNYTLGWPAFTPDTKWVVYHAGSNDAFETDQGAVGDLYFADVASHKVARLDLADGYYQGNVYLPDNDAHLNFAPTVLPVAVGGYFWVVFTSHRSYGNQLPSMDNMDQNGKLWVAAFDLDPTAGEDPSHPAFFLDGQETVSDNLRGFWVLNPCASNGSTCASGDDCCGGFCRAADGGPLQCVPPPGGCSMEYEACTTASDCCSVGFQCINKHCAQPAPT